MTMTTTCGAGDLPLCHCPSRRNATEVTPFYSAHNGSPKAALASPTSKAFLTLTVALARAIFATIPLSIHAKPYPQSCTTPTNRASGQSPSGRSSTLASRKIVGFGGFVAGSRG
ncbi:hypothetical protein DOTSEDRAFT_81729 [Dothistroma septosporum NZE10]|uniref:Uncharacterized protein n=1 Tax=Dothistroma septosporum (strain NZE10 / CBS 128990) TaxID=675120 RepID=N1PGA2_DOTSN|nr:hypothetical protein DOTSEDRAFT_81729 [Dothistroma septosporum NZE10]